ncbi:MAG: hypothetical protein Q9218_007566 [Villophora microphyllina]
MVTQKVIVFGPTGAVGSVAARTAGELGAKVVLAMRDTQKPIPGISAEEEKQDTFSRVHADLTKAETVRDAVTSTEATRAFIYLAHGSPDHMKATITALKLAGIELVLFLSSFTVRGDLAAIQPSETIPYVHAQVELNLREIFGTDGFVAIRPGYFASNTLQYKTGLEKGLVKIQKPDAKVDCIVPEDIGRVSGTILVKGPPDEERAIYLYGPELLSLRDTVKMLAEALGKDPKIEECSAQDAYQEFVEERKVPAPIAEYMVRQAGKMGPGQNEVFGYTISEEHLSSVEKHSRRKGTTFKEWAEQNKGMFVS